MQAVIATQTFGEFLGFNPHCHFLVTDGCFFGKGKAGQKSSLSNQKVHLQLNTADQK